jgi:hypothetical protein
LAVGSAALVGLVPLVLVFMIRYWVPESPRWLIGRAGSAPPHPPGSNGQAEALGQTRVPSAGYRPDHCASVELATIDAYRAAEAAADLERRETGSKYVTLR